jgi:hypothetical protein
LALSPSINPSMGALAGAGVAGRAGTAGAVSNTFGDTIIQGPGNAAIDHVTAGALIDQHLRSKGIIFS